MVILNFMFLNFSEIEQHCNCQNGLIEYFGCTNSKILQYPTSIENKSKLNIFKQQIVCLEKDLIFWETQNYEMSKGSYFIPIIL